MSPDFLYKFGWLYLLFVGTNGAYLWGVENKVYYAWLIAFFIVAFFFIGKKRDSVPEKARIWLVILVSITFFYKAYILKHSGAFVYSIPLLGAPFAMMAYSNYLTAMTKKKWGDLFMALLWFYVLEVGMAIVERMLGHTIIGIKGGEIQSDVIERGIYGFRSTAFWGHPLSNALVVSTLMSFLLVSSLKVKYKLFLWVVGYISILCFNTRGSIMGNALILLTYLLYTVFVARRIKNSVKISIIAMTIVAAIAILSLLLTTGLGGRLTHGTLDDSSVQTRIDIWAVFDNMSRKELLWGTDSAGIEQLMAMAGLYALENFWIILIMRFGLIFLSLYICVYAWWFKSLFEGYKLFDKGLIIVTFVLIASTNNSLADNFMPIFIFIVCSYIFHPRFFSLYVSPKYRESEIPIIKNKHQRYFP